MDEVEELPIAGKKFAAARAKLRLTQQELADSLQMSLSNERRIERAETTTIRPKSFRLLASLLKTNFDDLTRQLAPSNGVPAGITTEADTLPIPEWDIDLRASHWAAVPCAQLDTDDDEQRAVVKTGRFRLRILGNCMELPGDEGYRDGMLVEFQVINIDLEGMEPGHDYAVCRSDGTATFKRLVSSDEDTIVLAALNRKAFPDKITVPRQEVCRVAKVVYRLTGPAAAKRVK